MVLKKQFSKLSLSSLHNLLHSKATIMALTNKVVIIRVSLSLFFFNLILISKVRSLLSTFSLSMFNIPSIKKKKEKEKSLWNLAKVNYLIVIKEG